MKFDFTAVRFLAVCFVLAGAFSAYYFFMPFVSIPLRVVQNDWEPVTDPFSLEDTLHSDLHEEAKEWENSWEVEFRNVHSIFQNVMMGEEGALTCEKFFALIPVHDPQGEPQTPIRLKVDGGAKLQFSRTEDDQIRQVLGNLSGKIRLSAELVCKGERIPLELLTRDIRMGMTSCTTNQELVLKLGGNGSMPVMRMKGMGMVLRFSQQQDRLAAAAIGSVELQQLEKITLELTEAGLKELPWKLPNDVQKSLTERLKTEKVLLIQLTCRGPVRFDVAAGTLTFQKNVVISCEPKMQMVCEELTLKMRNKMMEPLRFPGTGELPQPELTSLDAESAAAPAEDASGMVNAGMEGGDGEERKDELLESLHARQITRFQIGLPSMDWVLDGTILRLDYHFSTKKLELNSDTQFMLTNSKIDFSASNLSYVFPSVKEDEIGVLNVEKSGNLTYKMQDQKGMVRPVKLSWGQKLETFFDASRKVTQIQIFENVVLHSPELNGFSSEEAAKNSENAVLCTDKVILELRAKTELEKQREISLQRQLGMPGTLEESEEYTPVSLKAAGNVYLNLLYEKSRLKGKLEQFTVDFQIPDRLPDHLWQSAAAAASVSAKDAEPGSGAGRHGIAGRPVNGALPSAGGIFQNGGSSAGTSNAGTSSAGTSSAGTSSAGTSSAGTLEQERLFAMKCSTGFAQLHLLPGKESVFVNCLELKGAPSQELILRDMDGSVPESKRFSIQAHRLVFWYLHPTTLSCEIRSDENAPERAILLNGDGIQLVTSELLFNLAANHVEVPVRGKMTILLDSQNKKNGTFGAQKVRGAGPEQIQVQWGERLVYEMDGFQVEGNVQIETPNMKLNAARIRGVFEEALPVVSLLELPKMEKSELVRLFRSISVEDLGTENGNDGVLVQFWNYREGRLRDQGWLRTSELYLFPGQERQLEAASGKIWIAHWDPNDEKNEQEEWGASRNENGVLADLRQNDRGLEYYQILAQYDGELAGNLFFGEFTLSRNIKACGLAVDTIAPVIAEIPLFSALPPNAVLFDCNRIEICQTPSQTQSTSSQTLTPSPSQHASRLSSEFFPWVENTQVELNAIGNVRVRGYKKDGGGFSIDGALMRYSQNRGVCTITGDGNIPVLLTQQVYPGGPRDMLNADSVEIHQKTMELKLQNIRVDGMLRP